jgi:hypothetical protein
LCELEQPRVYIAPARGTSDWLKVGPGERHKGKGVVHI